VYESHSETRERAALETVTGIVFDVQRYSLHDGPGLRTNIFLKGCPLSCSWCCNPESQAPQPTLAFFTSRCYSCGDCLNVCQSEALWLQSGGEQPIAQLHWRPDACDLCGDCADVCASGAIQWVGRQSTAAEVLEEALRDAVFYGHGGGITLTGGEPLLQHEFAYARLRLARGEYMHTAMETCGHAPWFRLERLLPYLNLVLYDVKHMDSEQHRLGTGMGNELILENARRIVHWKAERGLDSGVVIRLPLMRGRFALELGIGEMHLLPYHRLGGPKYQALGRSNVCDELPLLIEEEVEEMASLVRSLGLRVLVGG
jgi:pyruvate formate lyase activating enzyme